MSSHDQPIDVGNVDWTRGIMSTDPHPVIARPETQGYQVQPAVMDALFAKLDALVDALGLYTDAVNQANQATHALLDALLETAETDNDNVITTMSGERIVIPKPHA